MYAIRSYYALYKYITLTPTDKPHNFQVTAVWFRNFLNNKITFSGFADFWKEDAFSGTKYTFLSEPQLWYNYTKNLSLGGEVEFSNDFGGTAGFKVRPTLALKWNFYRITSYNVCYTKLLRAVAKKMAFLSIPVTAKILGLRNRI